MNRPSAGLWIEQAESDLFVANLLVDNEVVPRCHSIAKLQQSVEKALKGIGVMVVSAAGLPLPANFEYEHRVRKLLQAFQLGLASVGRYIQARLQVILRDQLLINLLSELAPKRPSEGELHRRNTEYPYEVTAGIWSVPARSASFTELEAKRFQALATRVVQTAKRMLAAIRLTPI